MFATPLPDCRPPPPQLKGLLDAPGGGDWERRNRLKVYEGLLHLCGRDFASAAPLLLDSLPTFTATEACTYDQLVLYAVAASLVSLDRVQLAARVVKSPEVAAHAPATPCLAPLLAGLHGCRYAVYAAALPPLADAARADPCLAPHARRLLREARRVGYAQYLEAYRSVTLASMAAAFGLSPAFLDAELAGFIAAGALGAKIDRVAGVLETTRPGGKGAQFGDVIRTGDALLNRLQRLGRAGAAA